MAVIISNLSLIAQRNLDRALEAILKNPAHPLASLSIVAIKNGSVNYAKAFGRRYIDPEIQTNDKPATIDTRYRVASISKVVTAIAALQLVESDKLGLDTDVSLILGWNLRNPNFPSAIITLRMLLSHTSSICDDNGYVFPHDVHLKDVLRPDGAEYDAKSWLQHAPGFFCYANLNSGLIATMIERVTNTQFDQYVNANVLLPLGISGGFNPAGFSNSKLKHLAALYRKQVDNKWDVKNPWVAQIDDYTTSQPEDPSGEGEFELGTNGSVFSPQGGLRATPLELSRIVLMLMNGGTFEKTVILKPETVQTMLSEQWLYDTNSKNGDSHAGLFRSWGLGMQRITDFKNSNAGDRLISSGGLKWVGHLGDAYGLRAGMFFDPVKKNGIIYVIGGLGANPETSAGKYSSFSGFEENILNGVYDNAIKQIGEGQK